jgi:hypothetical protein
MKLLAIFSTILLICLCTSTSSADIYSWTDKSGVTHFTNYSPPPGAKLIVKDIPIPRRTLTDNGRAGKADQLGNEQELERDTIRAGRKKAEAMEEGPYPSENDYPDVRGTDPSKNRYVSEYPPGFHRYPPDVYLLKHHPNYHYKYHLDKPYAKKHYSAYGHGRHHNKPTIWDRDARIHQKHLAGSHRKRVFGWHPPNPKNRPSAHYFAFGGGHYRGTSIRGKSRFGGRGSAFVGRGRFGGRGSGFGGRGGFGGGRGGR